MWLTLYLCTTSCELIVFLIPPCMYVHTQRKASRNAIVDEPRLKQADRAESLHRWGPVSDLGLENCSNSGVRAQICCSTPFSTRQGWSLESNIKGAIIILSSCLFTHFLGYIPISILHIFSTVSHHGSIKPLSLCLCRSHSFMLLHPSNIRSSVAL